MMRKNVLQPFSAGGLSNVHGHVLTSGISTVAIECAVDQMQTRDEIRKRLLVVSGQLSVDRQPSEGGRRGGGPKDEALT